jgi:hypothetical protein
MKSFSVFPLLLVFTLFQVVLPVVVNAQDKQPHMKIALRHLETAQTAEKPMASLKAARKQLLEAKPNKEGERLDAIADVNEAIAYATTGDKKKMQVKITKAIGNVKSGIARAK